MSETDRRQKIIATLKAKDFVQNLGSSEFQFEGNIHVGHSNVSVQVNIPDTCFSELPRVKLLEPAQLPQVTIAHLDVFNRICYANISLLRLDHTNPGGSILRVIEEAKTALETSLGGNASAEIAVEYPMYWVGCRFYIVSNLSKKPIEGNLGETAAFRAGTKRIFEPKGYKKSLFSKHLRDVFWLPVKQNVSMVGDMIQPKTIQHLDLWWSGNGLKKQMSISKLHGLLLKKKVVIVSAPNAIVGVEIDGSGYFNTLRKTSRDAFLKKYLQTNGQQIDVKGYIGTDASPAYIASRNLGEEKPPLMGKSITLIGCGTIGSHLGKFLVQNGAGQKGDLTVVDNDYLSAGNLGRHLLSYEDLGRSKSEALANELNRFHPSLTVQSINDTVQNVWHRIQTTNLIIDATGVENISEFLNIKAMERRASGKTSSLLHLFLWHNGIAAQSFLNAGSESACYRCLKPELQWRFDPRKNVSDSPKIVANRCGDGPYLPFSVAASVSAAALGLEAVLDFFSSNQGSFLRTHSMNEKLTKRIKNTRPSKSKLCPLCSV